jgi:hypothetical protein
VEFPWVNPWLSSFAEDMADKSAKAGKEFQLLDIYMFLYYNIIAEVLQ